MTSRKPLSAGKAVLIGVGTLIILILLSEAVLSGLILLKMLKPVAVNAINLQDGLFKFDPVTGWRLRPGAKVTPMKDDGGTPEYINRSGWRDWPYPVVKPESAYRIGVMGDSYIYGHGLKWENTPTRVLHGMFGESGQPEVQVLNFGVIGWGLDQMLLGYKAYVRPYTPDLLLVFLSADTLLRTGYTEMWGAAKPYFVLKDSGIELKNSPVPAHSGPVERWLLRNSVLYRLIKRQWLNSRDEIKYQRSSDYEKSLAEDINAGKVSAGILRLFQDETRKDGVHLVVVVYDRTAPLLLEACREAGVEAFDLQDVVPEVDLRSDWRQHSPLHFSYPLMQWNEEGSRWVADGLYRYINMHVRPRPMLYE